MKPNDPQIQRLSTKLSSQDKIEILLNAVSGLIIVFLVYLGVILGFNNLINIRRDIWDGLNAFQFFQLYRFNYNLILTIITLGIGFNIVYKRSRRYYSSIITKKVINHLNLVATTKNYNYRIESHDVGNLNLMIESINALIESTQRAFDERKMIEESKDELIANISHDIRTPLTSIIGYLDVVKNEQYRSEADQQRYLEIASNKAELMKLLVDDLFYYIESSQPTFHMTFQEVPLYFFLLQVAAENNYDLEAQGISITVDVEPEELTARIDPDKMVRIFNNFISNAAKYGHGDTITLRAYQGSGEQAEIVFLEVRNNGDVLDETEFEKVFERSYRSEKSRNSAIPGSGLGLSIVSNLTHAQGGQVYATVENNETVFRIELDQNYVKDEMSEDDEVNGKL